MLGVKTIGNATLIAFDGAPVLVTDPWLGDVDPAYFGSWVTSHEIPDEQLDHVRACPYLWISHGHPDHLSPASLETLRDKGAIDDDLSDRIKKLLVEFNEEFAAAAPAAAAVS